MTVDPHQPPAPSRSSARATWGVVLVVVGASLLVGLAVGLAWLLVAPQASATVAADGGASLDGVASGRLIAADGWFAALAAVAGLGAGALGWAALRRHPLGLSAGLVAGGLVGALVAWWTGAAFGPDPLNVQGVGAAAGDVLTVPLTVRARAVLFVWPIAALVMLFALVAGAERPRARVSRVERSEPPSPR